MKCSKCKVTIYDESFRNCPVCGEKIPHEEDKVLNFGLLKSVIIMPFLLTNLFIVPLLLTYVLIYILKSAMEPFSLFIFTMHYFLLVAGIVAFSIFLLNVLNNSTKKVNKQNLVFIGVLFVSAFLLTL